MNNKQYFERNIKLNYIIGSLMWGRFFIPILALFYIASQVTLEQFTIIMAVFAFSTFVLEIPTGVIADLLGKKKALLISRAMYVIEIILIAFFNGFWIFLVAKIISGIGVSFGSGTNSALLYDSLKRLEREKEHKKISGLANTISKISMAIVFIIGAYLFSLNYKLPAIASLPLIILGFILTFFLKEPYQSKTKINFKNSLSHMKKGLVLFKNNYNLKYLAFFTFLIGSTISMMLSLSSKYFEAILIFISIFLMSFIAPYIGLLFFLIIAFVQGFYEVIIGDYVNRHVESSHRATMLSINNMFDNIGITLLFPLIGYLNKAYSLKISLLSFSIFILVCSLFIIFYYKNNHNHKEDIN